MKARPAAKQIHPRAAAGRRDGIGINIIPVNNGNNGKGNNGIEPPKTLREGKSKDKILRIIPLGGLEEVGRNMTVLEYGKDIIIIDMGLQFPEEDMHGIDYIIPNSRYLRDKTDNIRGVIVTHGHLDHIGAIPHHVRVLGNPPIYTGAMTKAIILKRQEEFKDGPRLRIHSVNEDDYLQLGIFEIEFFHVCHIIPDSLGFAIHTPVGTIIDRKSVV